MKWLFLLIVNCILIGDDVVPGDISFSYGFLGRLQANSNPDSIVELFHESIIQTNDRIRVNAGYLKNTHFYLIYNGSMEEYVLLYNEGSNLQKDSVAKANIDTLFTTLLPWSVMTDPPGDETFYLINSRAPLTDLTNLLTRYEDAPEKGKSRLVRKIQAELDDLDPTSKKELASLSSRLDKPLVGGVAFRGDDDDEIKDMSLTHKCIGKGGIAFKKIVLQHK